MKKWWVRISCLLLALLLLATAALPAFAAEDEQEENSLSDDAQEEVVKDYVILLDCSMSTSWNDEQALGQQAYLNFLDKMPLTGARVTIIAFGYEAENYYDSYSRFTVNSQEDKKLIHVLANQVELSNSATRDMYKEAIVQVMDANRYNKQTWTPYAHALAAAVELLEQGTDKDAERNACIILVTDGLLDDRKDGENDVGLNKISDESITLLNEASKAAGDREWPIYSIHLNYGNKTAENVMKEAGDLLDLASGNAGWTDVGRVPVASADEVFLGLTKIFADFQMIKPITYDLELPGDVEFEVEALTSEATIDIFGNSIETIQLQKQDADGNWVDYGDPINSIVEEDWLIVAKGDSYYSIKLVCPPEGKWRAHIEGEQGVNVQVSICSLKEMNLVMSHTYEFQEDPLTKNNTVYMDAVYRYREKDVDSSEAYNTLPATLKVYHYTDAGIKAILVIKPDDPTYGDYCSTDKYGYHFKLPLNLFHNEDKILVQLVVESPEFRDGVKRGNTAMLSFTDLHPEPVMKEPVNVTVHVGESFKLNMSEYFTNPDGDPMTYTLTCPDASFEMTQEDETLKVQAGLVPGTYAITLGIEGESVSYDRLTLQVLNDPVRLYSDLEPNPMELWSDHYGFQNVDDLVDTIVLSNHFSDNEGMPLTYTVSATGDAATWAWDGSGVLKVTPVEGMEGDVTITITATDGIVGSEPATATLNVSVVSGKVVFWRDNWIYFAIAAAILIIIIIVIIILIKNKRVKGEWEIIMDDDGNQAELPNMNIANYTAVGKRGKFLLKDLINELVPFMDETGSLAMVIPDYFSGTGAENIELVGVFGPRGCTVNKIPKNEFVKVVCNGAECAKNKATLSSGTLTVRIAKSDGTGAMLTISMRLL